MEFWESNELKRGVDGGEVSPPSGVCFFGDIVVVSDEFNHRVELLNPETGVSRFVGKQGNSPGEFYYPKGVQADMNGNFYVADCWNHRVQKFSRSFEFLLSFGKYGDGPGEFNEPYSIAVGPDNLIYVVDRCNHRIQLFDTEGNFIGAVGQRGTALEEDLAELYGTPENLFKKPSFEFPNDIAFDSHGNMFVVDSNNHRIVCLDREGGFLSSFGSKGSGEKEFRFPYGICIDENDLLFISDMNNERVQVYTPQGVLTGTYRGGEGADLLCPATIRRTLSGDLCYATGFSPSLFLLSYRHQELSEFYKNEVSLRESRLPEAVYKYGNGEEDAATSDFISLITECTSGDLIAEISYRFEYITLCLKVIGPQALLINNNFDVITALLETSFGEQTKILKALFDKRAELNRELFENQHRRESEILNGEDTFNPALITLEREDRELFREIRLEMLKLKRIFRLNASLPVKVLAYEIESGQNRSNAIDAEARHTSVILRYVLAVLEEREEYHAGREQYFRDETKNREENLANFRFLTLLFDNIDSLTGILVDLLTSHLVEVNSVSASFSTEESDRFRRVLEESSDGADFEEVVSKIYLFTQDNTVPYYASVQAALKEFVSLFYKPSQESFDPKNPFGVGESENILKQIFNLMIFEELFLDSPEGFSLDPAPEILKTHEKSLEEVNAAIKKTFLESEKISAESALLDVRTNKTVVRDEKLRIALINKLNLHSFAERLNSRTLASLFLMQRINLLALYGSEGTQKRADNIDDLLSRSFENFYRYPEEMGESEEGKVKALLDLKVNAMKQLLKRNFLDISTIYRAEAGKPDIRGFSIPELKSSIPEAGQTSFNLVNPVGICREPGGTLLVADSGTNTVLKMTGDGRLIGSLRGREGFDGNFFHPFGIAADSNGDVFVSDWYKHRVQKFDIEGNFITSFGKKGSGEGEFNMPGRVAVDKDGGVYVCDQLNGRIQKFDNSGNHLFSFGQKGEGKEGLFVRPGGLLITSAGELLVGDYSGNRIQRFSMDGAYLSDFYQMDGTGESCVVDISQNNDGTIFVSDFWRGEITLFSDSGGYLGKVGGEGRGRLEFQGMAAALIVENTLFCCDFFGGRIKVVEFDLQKKQG